ncbi:MAG: 2-amino-4-hydroxy-6-hydroxymethyldihydropteridine diphosphokinase [Planctomycetota bacterium]
MAECLVSFGSNLGDSREVLAAAAERLAAMDGISQFRASRLFETPAVGGPPNQPPFLNAVAALHTELPARSILEGLQSIEAALGRTRRARWGARTIDLDVVLHGPLIGGASELTLPHPRYTARRFVLLPACDVAGDYRDPRFHWSIEQLAAHISRPPASLALVGGDRETRQTLCQRVAQRFGIRHCHWTDASDGSVPWIRDDFELEVPIDPHAVTTPRLLVRLFHQETRDRRAPGGWITDRWPAPHRMFPRGRSYPEYHLEISDLDWAVNEIGAAFESMTCDCMPVTPDGSWAITQPE